jgi:hypothetical protein
MHYTLTIFTSIIIEVQMYNFTKPSKLSKLSKFTKYVKKKKSRKFTNIIKIYTYDEVRKNM